MAHPVQLRRKGFTITELMVVVSILMIVAGLLLPALAQARLAAISANCSVQLGHQAQAIHLYGADYDDRFPNAIEPHFRPFCNLLSSKDVPRCKLSSDLTDLLPPYGLTKAMHHCPLDTGVDHELEFYGYSVEQHPSSFASTGSSYWFNEELTLEQLTMSSVWSASAGALNSDRAGVWHGQRTPLEGSGWIGSYRQFRYATVFVDGHTRTLNADQLNYARGAVSYDGNYFINARFP